MPNDKMLIDASHPEETRVVLLRGNRIEEFDFESQAKKQLRGNIYLAKVTRVEPSLQAAFVEYGGNRHGFLAFSEIHPDYYQIPFADRQALLAEDSEDDEEDTDNRRRRGNRGRNRDRGRGGANAPAAESDLTAVLTMQSDDAAGPIVDNDADHSPEAAAPGDDESLDGADQDPAADEEAGNGSKSIGADIETDSISEDAPPPDDDSAGAEPEPEAKPRRRPRRRTAKAQAKPDEAQVAPDPEPESEPRAEAAAEQAAAAEIAEQSGGTSEPIEEPRPAIAENGDLAALDAAGSEFEEEEHVESVGQEDALEELPQRRRSQRSYKIQEVIKRRQIMLVQVVKEERGNKGAALTTYLSLAGRYCVLMPNTGRGGGISRKITSAADRKRLKEIAGELEVPQGMGVILRTAGANRNKAEIRRDFEYLLRLWETVRNLTLASTAPCLVYEEGSLVKRSIRDLYDKDTGEILVQGEAGYREAKDFMRMLMPSHAKNVKLYAEDQAIFARHNVEAQLDRLLTPQVTLKSGGYLVINQTEALVSIDVNSGKATREHSIEDTALKTNLEASDEIARQLRLRDLAGLIVIDFIDMEEKRNNRSVEKRLKDALKNDRARIQVGRISHFGLMEMSRQRIRVSVMESTMDVCPHCQGLGHVRSHSSIALHVFRSIDDHLMRHPRNDLTVRCPVAIALEILNTKRAGLSDLEMRYGVRVTISADASLPGQNFVLEKGEPATGTPRRAEPVAEPIEAEEESAAEVEAEDEELAGRERAGAPRDDAEAGNGRRRRRRRRGRRGGADSQLDAREDAREEAPLQASEPAEADDEETGPKNARRRGRRGRRTHARDNSGFAENRAPDTIAGEEGSEEIGGRQEANYGSEAGSLPDRERPRRESHVPAGSPLPASDDVAEIETPSGGQSATENSLQQARRHRNTRRAASVETSLKSPAVDEEPASAPEAEGKRSGWWRRGFF